MDEFEIEGNERMNARMMFARVVADKSKGAGS